MSNPGQVHKRVLKLELCARGAFRWRRQRLLTQRHHMSGTLGEHVPVTCVKAIQLLTQVAYLHSTPAAAAG